MFKTKYQKMLDILDSEIETARHRHLTWRNFKDYGAITDPTVRDGLRLMQIKLENDYLSELHALTKLKTRLQDEIGTK